MAVNSSSDLIGVEPIGTIKHLEHAMCEALRWSIIGFATNEMCSNYAVVSGGCSLGS